ncbi:MAG: hypothetical protein NHG13_00925 [Candidatus Shikimatogenerans bostrichidophilus]|nr:MAG: hypothetical protein NHG13_00925 [Candidatus Shikimatogenerans bostrichidophilus]
MNNIFKYFFYNKNIDKEELIQIIRESISLILKIKKEKIKLNFKKKQIKINNKIIKLTRKKIFIIGKVIIIKINEIINKKKYEYYKKKKGKIIKAEVKNILFKKIILLHKNKNELYYKIDYKIDIFFFKIGYYYHFLVKEVLLIRGNILIILSRKEKLFIYNLLKLEIPEIKEGIIKIVKIIRKPGIISKIFVKSKKKNIDPISICLGIKGYRLKNLLNELYKEKIEIIKKE